MSKFQYHGLNLLVPPPIVFTIALVMTGLLSLKLPLYQISSPWQIICALVLVILSAMSALLSLWSFYRHQTTVSPHVPHETTVLITSGIFAYTRNPMYLSLLLAIAAVQCWWGALSGWGVLPLFVLYMNRFQIEPEEDMLQKKFGGDYRAYLNRSKRWF